MRFVYEEREKAGAQVAFDQYLAHGLAWARGKKLMGKTHLPEL